MHHRNAISIFLSLLTTVTRITSLDLRANDCPYGVTSVTINGKHYCCPGSIVATGNDDGYCCVGGDIAIPSISFCPSFPFCSTTAAQVAVATPVPSPSCRTTIPFSATDYSALASAAATKTGRAASRTVSGGAGMSIVTGRVERWICVAVVGAVGAVGGL